MMKKVHNQIDTERETNYILKTGRIIGMLLLFFCIKTGLATNYYVSTTGNDLANGSQATPFKTITKAASMVVPGDTVFVAGGTYIEHNIIPKSSGTINKMIVFKPSPGTDDVIVKHPGVSITDNTPVFQLSNRKYIWIEGFYFKDFKYGRACIYISAGEGNVIINNRFENLGNGEVGTWDGNQMVALFNSYNNVVCNNYFKNITGDGINVNSQQSVRNLVCYNTFIGFKGKLRSWGGTYLFSRAIDIQDMSNGNNVIAFNYGRDLYHLIWLDRDGSNNVVLRNFGDKGSGTVFNESRCAKNVIQENISINMNVGFMTAYYENTGWTIDPRWINNVAYKNTTGFSVHKSERDEFRNNISFNNTNYNMIFTSEALSNAPHIFKNNLWYSDSKTNSIEFKGSAVSVPVFQSGVGEKGGISVNPMFTNTSAGFEDFTLQLTSPARGTGYKGVDMGAYAVYGKSAVGCDTNLQITYPQVYFDSLITEADRGNQVYIGVQLSNAVSDTITVVLAPIAGDAQNGTDFIINDGPVITFIPGETQKQLMVSLLDSSEHNELVAFQLTGAVNAQPGARNLRILRIKKTPILTAYAGNDQTLLDNDKSGDENVVLDGSFSSDPNGTIVMYDWRIGQNQIATGVNPSVNLPVGIHTITLTVTDNEGNTATDEVIITVLKNEGIWLEAECGIVGSLWNTGADINASNDKYVTIKPGNNSNTNAPTDTSGIISYIFNLSESGIYNLYARVICPNANDDSFWLKMDNGTFASWNGIAASSSWLWVKYASTYNLSEGNHTLSIGYREDGAKLDKIWITKNGRDLIDEGATAGNCNVSVVGLINNQDVIIYPNPVDKELNLSLKHQPAMVRIYNSAGHEIFRRYVQTENETIDMAKYISGIYIISITCKNNTIFKKIIKE